jgi:hypothetical protein
MALNSQHQPVFAPSNDPMGTHFMHQLPTGNWHWTGAGSGADLQGLDPTLNSQEMAVGPLYDLGYKRIYRDRKSGKLCVTLNTGQWSYADGEGGERVQVRRGYFCHDLANNGLMPIPGPVMNATALRKEEYIEYDRRVIRAARQRLKAVAMVNDTAGSFGGFNGFGKMILEHEAMADPGQAVVDMTGLTPGQNDMTSFQLRGLPLPITHCDFWVDARKLANSRNSGTPFDSNMGEACARRVGEMVEKTTIGNVTGITYGGASTYVGGYDITSKVYGFTNYPNRLTATGYKPTLNGRAGTGWTPLDTIYDVLAAIQTLKNNKFYGPYMIFHSNDWDQYLDRDYFTTTGIAGAINGLATSTLRKRICMIQEGDGSGAGLTGNNMPVILGCQRLDFLFGTAPAAASGSESANYYDTLYPFVFLIVQMTNEVVRMVNGLDVTTLQWEEVGGMKLQFKVMAIQVPQLFSDIYNNCGIMHMTFSS